MTNPSRLRRHLLGAAAALALTATAAAADQTGLGPWNADAASLAGSSALVTAAMSYIKAQAATLKDPAIRRETEDAVFNLDTCIKSRANLTPDRKQAIVAELIAEGLIDETEAGRIPGGLLAGVFPGVRDDGTACPKPPQPYGAAPGSVFGGHHSQPGGLAMHVAVNMTSGANLADTYRRVYGTLDARGLPVLRDGTDGKPDADLFIDQDIAIATPIWHDWAKTMVFQWNADGSEYTEMNFGGNGKTDAWGAPGTSKTGGHHILGVAEGMARGMPPAFLIAHASAHGAPNAGNEFGVVNWLRAAAIITGADPVERGYLTKDALGRLRLPPVRQLGSINVLASLPNPVQPALRVRAAEPVRRRLHLHRPGRRPGRAVPAHPRPQVRLRPGGRHALQHRISQPRADAPLGRACVHSLRHRRPAAGRSGDSQAEVPRPGEVAAQTRRHVASTTRTMLTKPVAGSACIPTSSMPDTAMA